MRNVASPDPVSDSKAYQDLLVGLVGADDPAEVQAETPRLIRELLANAAAAGFVLVLMTLAMNGLAIWLRYRLRRNLKW